MRDNTTCFSCNFFGTTCNGYADICTFTPRADMPEEERHEKIDEWLKGESE